MKRPYCRVRRAVPNAGLRITAAEADACLSRALARFEATVNGPVKVPLARVVSQFQIRAARGL